MNKYDPMIDLYQRVEDWLEKHYPRDADRIGSGLIDYIAEWSLVEELLDEER